MAHRRTSLLPLALLLLLACAAALVPPHFPRRFSASLEVTTKHLNKSNVYPPAWRTIDVDYDFIAKRARAYVQTSYEKRQKTCAYLRPSVAASEELRPSCAGKNCARDCGRSGEHTRRAGSPGRAPTECAR